MDESVYNVCKASLKDISGKYADISTTFNMYTEAVPAQYNEKNDAPALEKTDAASDEDFKTYLKSIKSVTVKQVEEEL